MKLTPWQQLLYNIANLLKVKTLITLAVIFALLFMILHEMELPNTFVMITTAIVTYYFTKAEEKGFKIDE